MFKPILGIIGGGQLGSMLAVAANKLEIKTVIFCDDVDAPAQNFSTEFIHGQYNDPAKIKSKKVSIVMGSQSDFKTMVFCQKMLKSLGIKYETKIISAHRTPDRMYEFAKNAESNRIEVIIAGAGGSAHLPGMISALTTLPVLGVPIESKKLKGLDSLLSIAQMPKGIPVGTLAIGEDGAINAALLAASIIGNSDNKVKKKLNEWRLSQSRSVKKKPN